MRLQICYTSVQFFGKSRVESRRPEVLYSGRTPENLCKTHRENDLCLDAPVSAITDLPRKPSTGSDATKLFVSAEVAYDPDHMLPEPLSLLPPGACCAIDMQQGDLLFLQSQPATGMFLVQTGSVTLSRTTRNGDTLTLHRAEAGGYFAEASVFSDHYHCDAICTGPGRVLKINKSDVVTMMRSDPVFSESFARLLARQVQHFRAHAALLGIRSARDRVLAAVQAGYFEATVTEFASRINLTHEACYRALRALCHEGLMVQTGRGRYALADP